MNKLTLALIIIGAINWGLVGLFKYDLISSLIGTDFELLTRIIFALVGIAGLYAITFLFNNRKMKVE